MSVLWAGAWLRSSDQVTALPLSFPWTAAAAPLLTNRSTSTVQVRLILRGGMNAAGCAHCGALEPHSETVHSLARPLLLSPQTRPTHALGGCNDA